MRGRSSGAQRMRACALSSTLSLNTSTNHLCDLRQVVLGSLKPQFSCQWNGHAYFTTQSVVVRTVGCIIHKVLSREAGE